MVKKGNIPWNKGLTKEKDERVKSYCEKLTTKRRSKIAKSGWNKMSEKTKKLRSEKIGLKHKGKKHSEETKKKISDALKGKDAWNKGVKGVLKPNKTSFKKGHKQSKEIIEKKHKTRKENGWFKDLEEVRRKRSGKNHWNWKGGKLPFIIKIRCLYEYKNWRFNCMKRDNFTCKKCGKNKGGHLEVHHKKSLSCLIYENNLKNINQAKECKELWNLDNGITYCVKCHCEEDNYRGKFKK